MKTLTLLCSIALAFNCIAVDVATAPFNQLHGTVPIMTNAQVVVSELTQKIDSTSYQSAVPARTNYVNLVGDVELIVQKPLYAYLTSTAEIISKGNISYIVTPIVKKTHFRSKFTIVTNGYDNMTFVNPYKNNMVVLNGNVATRNNYNVNSTCVIASNRTTEAMCNVDFPMTFEENVVKAYHQHTSKTPIRRKALDEFMNQTIQNMTIGEELVTNDGQKYNATTTFKPNFTWAGYGNVSFSAFTPHIMIGAKHFPGGYNTMTHTNLVTGQEFTVKPIAKYNIKRMCELLNVDERRTKELFGGMSCMDDILFIILDPTTPIPDECCPYVATRQYIENEFGSTKGLTGWTMLQGTSTQDYGNKQRDATPIMITSIGAKSYTVQALHYIINDVYRPKSDLISLDTILYQPVHEKLYQIMNERDHWIFPCAYVCDSGKPIFLHFIDPVDNIEKDVVIGTYYDVDAYGGAYGPCYADIVDILKKVAEYFGDTLKTLE